MFARLVDHVGERGRMNELALARLLESFVPARVGVGTGVLIDSRDAQSRQTDVVLFDAGDQPAVMAQTTQVLFPIEVVLGCVEVKTTLTSGDVADCLQKRRSLHALQPVDGPGVPREHPPFVVLAYNAGLSPEGCIQSFARDVEHLPDLLCILEIGLVAGRAGVLKPTQDSWEAGLALAQQDEDGGWSWVAADGAEERVQHEGRPVSVVAHDNENYAADPGRALLLFADALARLVADRASSNPPVLSYYLTERARALAPLPDPHR